MQWHTNYLKRFVKSVCFVFAFCFAQSVLVVGLQLCSVLSFYACVMVQECPSLAPEVVSAHLQYCLSLVAIATVCDVVPLEAENRALAQLGLHALRTTTAPGIRALLDVALNQ